ncbi:MAG: FG-GAP-like repeat-containing protein [Desulfuromonadales bacterium]
MRKQTFLYATACLFMSCLSCNSAAIAGDFTFSTLAGAAGAINKSIDGTGSAAQFYSPRGVTVDSAGTLYVADSSNNSIRKITTGGEVTTMAGLAGSQGSIDGNGSAARFIEPFALVVDGSGNLFVADTSNNSIRKITPSGSVTTFAGGGGSGSNDGTGTSAKLNEPRGIAVDSSGNLYVADYDNHIIRKITSAGVVTTLAGLAGSQDSTDGTGVAARFKGPCGIAVDSAGNVYVADTGNHAIRKITPAGVVTTFAGSPGSSGNADGTGTAARFSEPRALAIDTSGTLYVTDYSSNNIRKITSAGVVTTLAGTAGRPGSTDGTGTAALFYNPSGVTVDSIGNLYVTDTSNCTIRKITPAGAVTTFAGLAGRSSSVDGTGSAARFEDPYSVTADGAGNVYVADSTDHSIRKITAAGVVTTLAGTPGSYGSTDGTGSAARFFGPMGITADSAGTVYVSDTGNNTIRKITSAGVVTTLAGMAGIGGSTDATGTNARFGAPEGIAVDASGTLYVVDTNNNTIRKINPSGVVSTLAGAAGSPGFVNGTGSAARFSVPFDLAVDPDGSNVYVCDHGNHAIRKIVTATGVVTTLAGSGTMGYSDGVGTAAAFRWPAGVAVDGTGVVYVADTDNQVIRKITPDGVVTTIGGTRIHGSADGVGTAASFSNPKDIAVDSSGNLYVADRGNHTVRKGAAAVVTDGVCGSSNGASFTVAPTASLCSSGTASALTGSGPWGWTCAGLNGGTTASCSASLQSVTPSIIWRHQGDGKVYGMTTNGSTVTSGAQFWQETNPAWSIVGQGDFDGDGVRDLAWWNSSNGQVYLMLMSGPTAVKSGAIVYTEANTAWKIVATGDINGDGKSDLIWWNSSTGQVYAMLLNGAAVTGGGLIYTEPDTAWKIVAAADFNGNGTVELLWWNSSTGQTALGQTNGTSASTAAVIYTEANTDWRIAGAGDLDGDGKADIVWHNRTTGQVYGMQTNGTAVTTGALICTEANTNWEIVSIGDYTGDNKADLLWWNRQTGQVWLMPMNGLSVAGGSLLYTEADTTWHIQGETEWRDNLYGTGVTTTSTVVVAAAGGITVSTVNPQTVGSQNFASSTRLAVSWSAPSSSAVDHFEITAAETIQNTLVSSTSTTTSATLTGLKAATPYAVTVKTCANAACSTSASATPVSATTSNEYWQLQGSGNTTSGLSKIVSDGNVRISATRIGSDAGSSTAGRIQLYYGPSGQTKQSLITALTGSTASAGTPSSYLSFTGSGATTGLISPPSASTAVKTIATGQGVPLSAALGSKIRLFFEAEGSDGKNRIYSLDSQDGYVGQDFNSGSPTTCSTVADYSGGGGCVPTVLVGVEGDATKSNAKISNARQNKVGFPVLTDWRWDGATGTFMVFTTDRITGCSTSNMNHGYAVWDGSAWNVQYANDGCPKLFKSAQAAFPMHLGGVRYKLYYGDPSITTGRLSSTLPFLGPKKLIYADGVLTGSAGTVDFEDWESQDTARDVLFLWPNGDQLDNTAEGYIDDYHFLAPTGSLDLQVMYLAITNGTEIPFGAAALLMNP